MIKKNSKYLFLFILVFGILYTYTIIGEEYIRNTYMYTILFDMCLAKIQCLLTLARFLICLKSLESVCVIYA